MDEADLPMSRSKIGEAMIRATAAVLRSTADQIEQADDLAEALAEVERRLDYIRQMMALVSQARAGDGRWA